MTIKTARADSPKAVVSLSRYSQILEILVSGRSLYDLLEELCYLIEDKQPGCQASVLLLSDDGKRLTHGAAPSIAKHYIEAIDGVEIGHGVGSCGTSAFSKQLVVVDDIQSHPFWEPYKELAESANLRACWSQPIMGQGDKVLGTFAMYYDHPKAPHQDDLLLIVEASRLARFGIEYTQAWTQGKLSSAIAQHLPMGMVITDENFIVSDVNPAFCQMTGYSTEDVIGQSPKMLTASQSQLQQYREILQNLPANRSWTGEVQATRRNGETFTAEICFSAVRGSDNRILKSVALISDISERKRSEETIQYLANYDVLTNLPNRNLFYERMGWAIEHCRRKEQSFAVFIFDLDYFKEINDNHGHDVGDELLVKTANRLQQCFSNSDTTARLGGDEFAVIVSQDMSETELNNLAEKALEQIAKPFTLRQVKDCRISTSLGIARFPEDGKTIEQLMKAADQAVYAAKASGRSGHAFFTEAMNQEAKQQALLHQELRHAIERDQLELHFQPIKCLASNRISQLEALVRWNHPDRGMIRPDVFIPLAEKTGIIRDIGSWVRDAALKQIKHLQALGMELPIAVNLSTAEFYDNELATHIIDQIDVSGVAPELLVIEITESLFIQNQADTQKFLQELQHKNIKVALDDFGTGFSSLSYLAAFPVDKLKIDRAFIDKMCGDNRKQALVDTIITLGHSLGMQVIAEGVEEQEQQDELVAKRCDCIQGYYLSKPLNASAIETYLLSQ
ncbi:EAL domain-containing protein [Bacterioplanoides sp.]|uniref:sensor domain-containing phosphodiesterase n=1 Tax=Bacterioplanoides sp. TaxID=2066072 RepID=UPI003B5C35E9